MSQFDFGNLRSPLPGADFIDSYLEPWRDALHTQHAGTSAPSYVQAGMLWIDNSTTPWALKVFDGSNNIVVGYIDNSAHTYLSANISSAMLPVVGASTLATARTSLSVYSKAETYSTTEVTNALALKANLASPTFTGTPAAPTASAGASTTQIATTAFVSTAVAAVPAGGVALYQVFSSNGTWTKPSGISAQSMTHVEMWGGGSGGTSGGSSGGGGGAYAEVWFLTSTLGATEGVGVGAGGTVNGGAGGDTSFHSVVAYGGANHVGGGSFSAGGGAGGVFDGGNGGAPDGAGNSSVYGGGGGGGGAYARDGGSSKYGGNGGKSGGPGVVPGGGGGSGGSTGAVGARGEVRITTWY